MTGFLVHYNRATKAVSVERFEDVDESIQALNRSERALGAGEEVVLLFANSEETIRRTHPRFFMPAAEYFREAFREASGVAGAA